MIFWFIHEYTFFITAQVHTDTHTNMNDDNDNSDACRLYLNEFFLLETQFDWVFIGTSFVGWMTKIWQ